MDDGTLTVRLDSLIGFLDELEAGSQGHGGQIVTLIGEDLAMGAFRHFAESSLNAQVRIDRGSPKRAGKSGKRLDCWIEVTHQTGNRDLFQTEIKSWSAHAIGANRIAKNASPGEIAKERLSLWERIWSDAEQKPTWDSVSKVLIKMNPPAGFSPGANHKPMLIFWWPLHPEGKEECFFHHSVSDAQFPELWFFSVSTYLRSIQKPTIALSMPIVTQRLRWLQRIFEWDVRPA